MCTKLCCFLFMLPNTRLGGLLFDVGRVIRVVKHSRAQARSRKARWMVREQAIPVGASSSLTKSVAAPLAAR